MGAAFALFVFYFDLLLILIKGVNNMIKRCTAAFLAAIICGVVTLGGCAATNNGTQEQRTAQQSTDKYRNYYEIFVNSFCDSNGDYTGDIPGITEKLDYLNDGDPNGGDDLGIDGIWLTPVMKSSSYHKYNVDDYYTIDPTFGTMEDFETLLSKCNDKGINVIMDLVVNHTSNNHEWFKKACEEVKAGNLDGYAKYYHIAKQADEVAGYTYNPIQGTDYYYESNFDVTMPELNLNNEDVRNEIQKIMKFWLDKGVAGFRLDAVKYYSTGGDDGEDFLKWMYGAAKDIKSDVYMVGEDWAGKSEICDFYQSGIDSLFNFPAAGSTGTYESAVRSKNALSVIKSEKSWNEQIKEANENAIDASFLSNHDSVRSASSLGKEDLKAQKTAAMLYMLAPGNSFIYYGEEVGMLGSEKSDATYRIPMPWDGTEAENVIVPNLDPIYAENACTTTVKDAQADKNSLLYTYQGIIKTKLQNPEIQRGTIGNIYEGENQAVAGYITTYNDSSVIVVYNLSDDEATIDIPKTDLNYTTITAQHTAQDPDKDGSYPQAVLDGTKLTLPSCTVAILR